jgi:hypothetical protein
MGGCIGMSKNRYEIRPPLQHRNLNDENTTKKKNKETNELQPYWSNYKLEKTDLNIDDPNTQRVMKTLGI